MSNMNRKTEEPVELKIEEPKEKPVTKNRAWIGKLSFVMSGDVFSKESFVKLFPFVLDIVLLLMIYIKLMYNKIVIHVIPTINCTNALLTDGIFNVDVSICDANNSTNTLLHSNKNCTAGIKITNPIPTTTPVAN